MPAARLPEPGEVHVWFARLHVGAAPSGPEVLSPEERERAARFHFDLDRSRFLARRILLRSLLASYLGIRPGQIPFRPGAYGKPEVENTAGLAFNASHSHGLALFAFACGSPVGVDCERIRPGIEIEAIARKFFSPGECRQLERTPETERLDVFYRCWSRKEAYVKARGLGLSLALDSFDVPLDPEKPAPLVACRLEPGQTARWLFFPLSPVPGYAAAVVAASHSQTPVLFEIGGEQPNVGHR